MSAVKDKNKFNIKGRLKMSQIHRKFTPEFKSKVVLELLETGKSVNEIASKYNLLPKSVTTWKKQF